MNTLPVKCETVDTTTGKVIETETVKFGIMPPPAGSCAMCGVRHEPGQAHNNESVFYQYRFYGCYSRWPTWEDAIAHCSPEMQAAWKADPIMRTHWTVPPAGATAIAEPYREQGAA